MRDDPEAEGEGVQGIPVSSHDESAIEYDGFNLHASVAIAADDDVGRERLQRYGARPPLALGRLRRLPGGQIAYRIKKLKAGRAKSRVMAPLEFLARLAALVAPPRYPLLRYHGVLGPRSPWRRDIVPRAPTAKPCDRTPQAAKAGEAPPDAKHASKPHSGANERGSGLTSERATTIPAPVSAPEARSAEWSARVVANDPSRAAVLLAPNILSTTHWDRLLGSWRETAAYTPSRGSRYPRTMPSTKPTREEPRKTNSPQVGQ